MASYAITSPNQGPYTESTSPSLSSAGWTLVSKVNGGNIRRGDIIFINSGSTDVYLVTSPVAIGSPSFAAGAGILLPGAQIPPVTFDFPASDDYFYATSSGATGNSLVVVEMT